MIYLILSVLTSSMVFVILSGFGRFGIDNRRAIVINYLTALSLGVIWKGSLWIESAWWNEPWAPHALYMGFLFIFLFNVLALGAQKTGVSVSSVAVKMSVAIPVTASLVLYNEQLSLWGALGIAGALMAVFLITRPNRSEGALPVAKYWYLPVTLFFGAGLLDTLLKYHQTHFVQDGHFVLYTSCVFGLAGLYGFAQVTIRPQADTRWRKKDVLAGLILGLPNFGSIYFLLKTLQWDRWLSSLVFPINNVAIVLLSAVLGVWLFHEKLNRVHRLGIGIAVLSIWLMAYAGQ